MSVAGKRLEIPNPAPIRLISAETKLARKAELNEARKPWKLCCRAGIVVPNAINLTMADAPGLAPLADRRPKRYCKLALCG